jgi:hypothetical protein
MPIRFSKPRLSEFPVFIGLNTPIAGLEGYTKTYRLPRSGLVQAILSEIVMALLCGNSRARLLISPIHLERYS